jgi:hypothetical protein
MEWIIVVVLIVVLSFYGLGRISRYWDIKSLKQENERLNAELRVLTKRDSKGRFTGGK